MVWESFLPHDYRSILSQSSHPSLLSSCTSKKHLFLSLCQNPVIIDNGRKGFALDKWSGKKCYILPARDLSIVWGDDIRYWRWNFDNDSRFEEVAELLNVCWLEIRGNISTSMLSPSTLYSAYLVFKLTEDAYGLEYSKAKATVGIGGEGESSREIYLDGRREVELGEFFDENGSDDEEQGPKRREDGWLEVELGESFNENGNDNEELEASVLEVIELNWKSGLIIQGIELRPKHNN